MSSTSSPVFTGNTNLKRGGAGGVYGFSKISMRSSLFTREKCADCFAKFICSGGCSANNYHYNGDINKPYEMTCAMMKKRIECAMHILAEKKRLAAAAH